MLANYLAMMLCLISFVAYFHFHEEDLKGDENDEENFL